MNSLLSHLLRLGFIALSFLILPIQTATSQVYYPHTNKLVEDTSGPYGYPSSIHGNLEFIGIYEDQSRNNVTPHLTKSQWTEIVLTWWASERADPAPDTTGLGGGPIDSNYIQAQMIITLYVEGDPQIIESLVSSKKLRDEEVRRGLRIALYRLGDRRQEPYLRKIILEDKNPEYRRLACSVISTPGNQSVIPILEKALLDPYCVKKGGCIIIGAIDPDLKFYPVRETAKGSIRSLKAQMEPSQYSKDILKTEKRKVEEFKKLLPHAEEYHQENAETIQALAEMFNR